MIRYLSIVLVVITLCSVGWADNFIQQSAEAVAEGVELSLLSGTVGWGAGAYWPLYEIERLETTVGPFIAFGDKLVAAGVGAKFAVEIPLLDNYIDFIAAGGAYKHDDISFEVWIGHTLSLK